MRRWLFAQWTPLATPGDWVMKSVVVDVRGPSPTFCPLCMSFKGNVLISFKRTWRWRWQTTATYGNMHTCSPDPPLYFHFLLASNQCTFQSWPPFQRIPMASCKGRPWHVSSHAGPLAQSPQHSLECLYNEACSPGQTVSYMRNSSSTTFGPLSCFGAQDMIALKSGKHVFIWIMCCPKFEALGDSALLHSWKFLLMQIVYRILLEPEIWPHLRQVVFLKKTHTSTYTYIYIHICLKRTSSTVSKGVIKNTSRMDFRSRYDENIHGVYTA